MRCRTLPLAIAGLLTLALLSPLHADVVFPVKAYVRPDEPIVVKFVAETREEGKSAVAALGAAAARLEFLFAPVPAGDIAAADGAPAFKILTPAGEPVPVAPVKIGAGGLVDLSAACPRLKEGGTFYLVWKDAPPLVINTLYNPDRGPRDLDRVRARVESLPEDQRKEYLAQFAPAVTHMELASQAVITTDKGVIKARFSYEVAPHTVDNFISLARQGYYDGSSFHRIISGFMIQGGDAYANMDAAGTGGPGYQIMKEFSDKKHLKGVLSMARSSDPNSAGSQFFIMHGANTNLDGQYSAFGDVFEGIEVVDTIARTPSEAGSGAVKGPDRPKIVSIRILPATAEIYGLRK